MIISVICPNYAAKESDVEGLAMYFAWTYRVFNVLVEMLLTFLRLPKIRMDIKAFESYEVNDKNKFVFV